MGGGAHFFFPPCPPNMSLRRSGQTAKTHSAAHRGISVGPDADRQHSIQGAYAANLPDAAALQDKGC